MESLKQFWTSVEGVAWWGNSVHEYVLAFGVFVLAFVVLKMFQRIVLRGLKKLAERTNTTADDALIKIFDRLRPPFYFFLALYSATYVLTLADVLRAVVDGILVIWVAYYVVMSVQSLIDYIVGILAGDADAQTKTAYRHVGTLGKFALWVVVLLVVLSNLGVDITALVASLGIGGLAIAFAFQKILEDLFASFAIHFDKPFVIGDFVIVGEHMGVVKSIGIKTTRIQALQGEEIVISNRELTSTRVQNFKKLEERRVAVLVGVTYDTPNEKLERIPTMMEDIVSGIEHMRFDRAHLKSFGDSALLFELVYFVESDDYVKYMDANHEFNLGLKAVFEQEGIEFAFPTQTIYVEKS